MVEKKTSKKQLEYAKKYVAKLDDIKVRVPKGAKDMWKKAAEKAGCSLNQYIIDSVEARISNDES